MVLDDFGEWRLGEVPEPIAGDDDVVVAVRAASLNPSDWKLADGWYRYFMDYVFPMRLGRDYAGVIVAVGAGVERFALGDEVFGHIPVAGLGRSGTLAERVALPAASCMLRRPAELSPELASAIPVGGLTALQAVEFIAANPGDRVLVVGAVGGVGSIAVQLLASRRAEVIATALPEDEAYLRCLGAADVVDYSRGTEALVAERYPEGIHHLLDLAGSDDGYDALTRRVHAGGRVASALGRASPDRLPPGVVGLNAHTPHDPALLERLAQSVLAGDVAIAIERSCLLVEADVALYALRDEHVRGKVVVRVE